MPGIKKCFNLSTAAIHDRDFFLDLYSINRLMRTMLPEEPRAALHKSGVICYTAGKMPDNDHLK